MVSLNKHIKNQGLTTKLAKKNLKKVSGMREQKSSPLKVSKSYSK